MNSVERAAQPPVFPGAQRSDVGAQVSTMPNTLAFLGQIGWTEIIILAVIGLLIFGRRLPEVGRSLGKGIVEFKKGLSGIEDDVNSAGAAKPPEPAKLDAGATGAGVDTGRQAATEAPAEPKSGADG